MIDSWKSIDSNQLIQRAQYSADMGSPYCALIKVTDNLYVVYSPGVGLSSSARKIIPANAKVLLLAPAMSHSLGLLSWSQEFTNAEIFSSLISRERIMKLTGEKKILPAEDLQQYLPAGVNIHIPPGSNLGEVWLSIESEDKIYWLVCDAFTNLKTLGTGFFSKLFMKLYGLRTGLVCHKVFARGVQDKSVFREWALQRFGSGKPSVIVPCHGEIYAESDCASKICKIVAEEFS